MAKFLGIDPGTKSFDFCGIEDEQVIFERSIPSASIASNPELFIGAVHSHKYDYIIGPSGYGLPVKRLSDLGEQDFFLLTLVRGDELGEVAVLEAMQKALRLLSAENVPMFFIPGIIHLPTVPVHRKLNKIDMGTADKLCCAALGIWDQCRKLSILPSETSFILLEVGYGYTASVAVEKGKIIDAIGGTGGSPGFVSLGSMDSELAYLLEKFKKTAVFSGGAYSLESNTPDLALLEKNGAARECLIEGALKDILALKAVCQPKEILLSGRLSRVPGISYELVNRLGALGMSARKLEGFAANSKEAAQGAALIANGLAGGKHKELVDCIELKKAKGTCLDYITIDVGKSVKDKCGII